MQSGLEGFGNCEGNRLTGPSHPNLSFSGFGISLYYVHGNSNGSRGGSQLPRKLQQGGKGGPKCLGGGNFVRYVHFVYLIYVAFCFFRFFLMLLLRCVIASQGRTYRRSPFLRWSSAPSLLSLPILPSFFACAVSRLAIS